MDWNWVFGAANAWSLIPWAMLILMPRGPKVHALVFYLGIGLFAAAYSVGLISLLVDNRGLGEGSFDSIEGVRTLFQSDMGLTIGWIHYLAFDLFVGQWIAKDADHKMVSRYVQAPLLLLTYLAGPLGLFVWVLVRERRARAMSGLQSKA